MDPSNLRSTCQLAAISSDSAEAHRQAGQVGCTQGGGLDNLRPFHRHIEDISLELHEEVVGYGAAVYLEELEFNSRIILHGLQDIPNLVSYRLRVARMMCSALAPRVRPRIAPRAYISQ